jgi:hypothetical protein
MPPDIEIRRFAGLYTDTASIEGEMDRLVRADNVMFDNDGVVQARHGFHLFSNSDNGEQVLQFIGKSELFFQRLFLTDSAYYVWEGGKPSPSLEKVTLAVSAGSRTTNVVTLTVGSGHGIVIGDQITVVVADVTYNGLFTVTATAATTISYAQVAANDAASGAGVVILKPRGVFGGNLGVEFDTKVYFPEGRFWDSIQMNDTPQQPAVGQQGVMEVHAERLWLADIANSSSRLYFSNPGAPQVWPAANFIDIDTGTGSYISALKSYQGRLYIFKRREIFVLDTPGIPSTWVLRRFARIGCQPPSLTEYDGVLYWVAHDGAYRFDGTTIEKVSQPINDVFASREPDEVAQGSCESTIFRDQWVIKFGLGSLSFRTFCFNTKNEQWSEWTFPWESATVFPVNLFSEIGNISFDANIEPGIYMTVANVAAGGEGLLLGQEIIDNTYWRDEIGTKIAPPTNTEFAFPVVLQTKFSELGDPLTNKRVHEWLFEWEGNGVTVEQIQAARGRVTAPLPGDELHGGEIKIERTMPGNILELDRIPGDVFVDRVRGIGYTRKMSLRVTAQNIRDVGFKLYRVAGRVSSRGRARRNLDQVT